MGQVLAVVHSLGLDGGFKGGVKINWFGETNVNRYNHVWEMTNSKDKAHLPCHRNRSQFLLIAGQLGIILINSTFMRDSSKVIRSFFP